MVSATDITSAAMQLSEHERLDLASRLLATVGPGLTVYEPEAWVAELRRRCSEHVADPTTSLSWTEVKLMANEQ